jgi:hypothetical protein
MNRLRKTFGHATRCLRAGALLAAVLAATSTGRGEQAFHRLPEFTPVATAVEQAPNQTPDQTAGQNTLSLPRVTFDRAATPYEPDVMSYQVLPEGLLYKSYLAGVKEPRFGSQWVYDRELGWIWDIALGGRVGILRYGTRGATHPQGWQIDMEGAALPRLDFGDDTELAACDYRFGVPVTFAWGNHQLKFGYYHLSSHLGDELMLRHPDVPRINFCRDATMFGYSIYLNDDLRLYTEADYALSTDDGAEPWEFQFGAEYCPGKPTGVHPKPFMAVHGHLRQELDYSGNVTVQSGVAWRGESGHLLRLGVHLYSGMSDQYEFFREYENKVGLGLWYDY